MTPPLLPFPPSALPFESTLTSKSQHRKGFDGNLKNCELLELWQYNCDLQKDRDGKLGENIVCRPVERLFRRCKIERELLWWRRRFGREKEVQSDSRGFGVGCLWLA
ncbi:uncharacterized protein EAF02_005375 [Botrytis sinoallii]|uniref:uncharacterized protein n=1 Tax=Botrytis sinoallii TaxID=1463999 RepID=UPI0019010318|nr:uncharacterized protein EAF02_005375 [Botrytis sinoallii]KAF7883455.1 hypothetical protein EAF02_005375 [Botrytis sinoallii]